MLNRLSNPGAPFLFFFVKYLVKELLGYKVDGSLEVVNFWKIEKGKGVIYSWCLSCLTLQLQIPTSQLSVAENKVQGFKNSWELRQSLDVRVP